MQKPKIGKNKILIIALIVVAVVGFYIFKSSSPAQEPLTTTEVAGTGTVGQELTIELNRLRALRNIQGDIFQDPSFVSLKDFTQTVVPQPTGRSNPFAPIGSSI